MSAYPDTSFLYAIHRKQVNSPQAAAARKQCVAKWRPGRRACIMFAAVGHGVPRYGLRRRTRKAFFRASPSFSISSGVL